MPASPPSWAPRCSPSWSRPGPAGLTDRHSPPPCWGPCCSSRRGRRSPGASAGSAPRHRPCWWTATGRTSQPPQHRRSPAEGDRRPACRRRWRSDAGGVRAPPGGRAGLPFFAGYLAYRAARRRGGGRMGALGQERRGRVRARPRPAGPHRSTGRRHRPYRRSPAPADRAPVARVQPAGWRAYFLAAEEEASGWPAGRARCGCARGRGPAAATALPCRRPRARWRQRPQVVDLDLEVQHLRLLAGPFRPGRRLIPGLALDVEVHASRRVPQLCPVRRIEVAYLEPEQALVEAGDGSRVGAVDGDADPSDGVVLTSTVLLTALASGGVPDRAAATRTGWLTTPVTGVRREGWAHRR